MYPVCEPTAIPAITTPSITACGSCSKINRSLQVPGSLSSPLHRTYFGFADCLGTNDHLIPVLKPAPPRPRNPEFFTSGLRGGGGAGFNTGIKARAATAAQSRVFHLVDDRV